MNNEIFHDAIEEWYCERCDYGTESSLKALFHSVRHPMRKRTKIIDFRYIN